VFDGGGDEVGVAPACGSGPVPTVQAITRMTVSSTLAMTATASAVRLEAPWLLLTTCLHGWSGVINGQ
jgi:hypothetical protein